ncbi:MAG: aggregation factor core [Pseudomonadota bacterium]
MKYVLAALAMLVAPSAIAADLPKGVSSCGLSLSARFVEGAPKDRFVLDNRSEGRWSITSARLELAPSRGGLIFDTVSGGGGVEVFQPFEGAAGSANLRRVSRLEDGGDLVVLDFAHFEPGEDYAFTIDVDDTAKASALGQIRVAGGEIDGARLRFVLRAPAGEIVEAGTTFGADAKAALVGQSGC